MSFKTNESTMEYIYRGDRLTAPELNNKPCKAVRKPNGKCIRGKNGNFLVEFENGNQVVVLGRQLRKIKQPLLQHCVKPIGDS